MTARRKSSSSKSPLKKSATKRAPRHCKKCDGKPLCTSIECKHSAAYRKAVHSLLSHQSTLSEPSQTNTGTNDNAASTRPHTEQPLPSTVLGLPSLSDATVSLQISTPGSSFAGPNAANHMEPNLPSSDILHNPFLTPHSPSSPVYNPIIDPALYRLETPSTPGSSRSNVISTPSSSTTATGHSSQSEEFSLAHTKVARKNASHQNPKFGWVRGAGRGRFEYVIDVYQVYRDLGQFVPCQNQVMLKAGDSVNLSKISLPDVRGWESRQIAGSISEHNILVLGTPTFILAPGKACH
ncbi:hypothetical protein BDP27DRAFT_1370779 [Rhodocollybia butyracea]|uniref:Uncharacterized protein n=1 Tax=Rhodocollybia butyracea TaxID=206335 RepID=A0A9P5PBC1_9AGAR|nr:hypothetical protein BDP27DRAFT_1370779 [Rhodocollybia butyracea]